MPTPSAPRLLRPALTVTALGLMVAVVLVSGIPFPGSEPPLVAAAYLADDQGERDLRDTVREPGGPGDGGAVHEG